MTALEAPHRGSSIFSKRLMADEMMDDFSIVDERLYEALDNLRVVNRYLGGHLASILGLRRITRGETGPVRILDLGTGVGDYPEAFVRWGERTGCDVRVVAMDANEATCEYAARSLDERLPAASRSRIEVQCGDALHSGFDDGAFDVVHAALFMHHLDDDEATHLVREMGRLSTKSLLINDLHRHPISFHAVRLIARALPVSEMFSHDGPLSVLRGFRREDLRRYGDRADVSLDVRWFPGFRWIATETR